MSGVRFSKAKNYGIFPMFPVVGCKGVYRSDWITLKNLTSLIPVCVCGPEFASREHKTMAFVPFPRGRTQMGCVERLGSLYAFDFIHPFEDRDIIHPCGCGPEFASGKHNTMAFLQVPHGRIQRSFLERMGSLKSLTSFIPVDVVPRSLLESTKLWPLLYFPVVGIQ